MEEEYSKAYLERTENGEESMLLLRIGSDIDATMIQSFLFSENISSLCLNQNINRTFVTTLSPIKIELYILKTDYSAAKEIIENFAMDYKGSLRLYDTNGNEISISVHPKNKTDFVAEQSSPITENTKASVETAAKPEKSNSSDNQKSKFTENFFSFDGICTLRKYWIHFLITIFANLIIFILNLIIFKKLITSNSLTPAIKWTFNGAYLLIIFTMLFHIFCLGIQRFRSIGKNPWLFLIPIYGSIIAKIIPSQKDQSNNKYLNSSIPLKKILIIISIILTIGNTLLFRIIQSITITDITNSINNIRYKTILEETKISDSKDNYVMIEKKWFHYYIYLYDEDVTHLYIGIFSKKETAEFLVNIKNKLDDVHKYDKSYDENPNIENFDSYDNFDDWCENILTPMGDFYYLKDFFSYLSNYSYNNVYVELFDSNNYTIRTFNPEQATQFLTDNRTLVEKMDEYGATRINYYLYDLDKLIENFQYYYHEYDY